MGFDRFLVRAAVTPPAVVLQTAFANRLGIIRDLAAHDVPVVALDFGPRAVDRRPLAVFTGHKLRRHPPATAAGRALAWRCT